MHQAGFIYEVRWCLLYAFFWVIPQRLNFMWHFRTHCLFHFHRLPAYEDGTDRSVQKCRIEFRRHGITEKKAYNIQNTVKVWNQEGGATNDFICCAANYKLTVNIVGLWCGCGSLPGPSFVLHSWFQYLLCLFCEV